MLEFKKVNGKWYGFAKNGAMTGFAEEKEAGQKQIAIGMVSVPVPLRRQGIGTQILKETIEKIREVYPDDPIVLLAWPMGESPPPLSVLKDWYGKNGFMQIFEDHDSAFFVFTNNEPELEAQLKADIVEAQKHKETQ